MKDNELYAKALVDGGYAKRYENFGCAFQVVNCNYRAEYCDPSAKTKEGYEQAFALEDWLREKRHDIWSRYTADGEIYKHIDFNTWHEFRLLQIKWCFSQPEIAEALK